MDGKERSVRGGRVRRGSLARRGKRLGEMWPGLPAPVVSAYGDAGNQASAMDRGAPGFVGKPVNFDGLRGTMAESMAESD